MTTSDAKASHVKTGSRTGVSERVVAAWPPEIELSGDIVRLIPLRRDASDALAEAVRDGDLWKTWYTPFIAAPEHMKDAVERLLRLRALGTMLPFVILDASTNETLGMTTFMNVVPEHRRLEIGSTWLRASRQRSAVNTECKWLLLRHAFETLDCIAVEFRTSSFNVRSRAAIERLGAHLDGILRSHQIVRDDVLRDTYVYSITRSEWPAVRANLESRLEMRR